MLVILITIIAALFTQLGYFFWKIAAIQIDSLEFEFKNYYLNRSWIIGLICTILGWIFFVKATDIGEISLVEPLMTIGEIFLILLAYFYFNERMHKYEWGGVILSLLGVVLLSSEAKITTTSLVNWANLYTYIFISFISGTSFFLISRKTSHSEVYFGIISGISFGVAAVLTELMTAYLLKYGHELISIHFFINPIFPFMMLANIASLLLIQMALKSGRVSIIIPVELAIVSLMSVLGGAFVFNEVITGIRMSGILLVLLGTFLIHRKNISLNS